MSSFVDVKHRQVKSYYLLLLANFNKINGKEIGFVIKTEKEILKIEVKYKESVSELFRNLDLILTKEDFEISQKPYKIPVSIFLLSLK